jgi:hypothetical protein
MEPYMHVNFPVDLPARLLVIAGTAIDNTFMMMTATARPYVTVT